MKEKLESFGENYKYKTDRITAYLLDILLVSILVSFLIGNSFTNPFYNKTREAYTEFNNVYKEGIKNINLSSESEVKKFTKQISPYYRTYYIRKNFAISLWTVILTVFYFGLFAYLNDGQTLGKKMSKLKVVNNKDGKSVKFYQLVIRNLFGNLMIIGGTNIVLLVNCFLPLIKNGYTFTMTTFIITIIGYIIDIVFLLLFIFKKNGRSLDDLVGSTKVISLRKKSV